MTHLKGFGLENFRVFKEHTWFDFAPITLLIGPNSSGKSSLTKALLLLKSSFLKYDDGFKLDFESDEIPLELGNFERVRNKDSLSNYITFSFPFELVNFPTLGESKIAKLKFEYLQIKNSDKCKIKRSYLEYGGEVFIEFCSTEKKVKLNTNIIHNNLFLDDTNLKIVENKEGIYMDNEEVLEVRIEKNTFDYLPKRLIKAKNRQELDEILNLYKLKKDGEFVEIPTEVSYIDYSWSGDEEIEFENVYYEEEPIKAILKEAKYSATQINYIENIILQNFKKNIVDYLYNIEGKFNFKSQPKRIYRKEEKDLFNELLSLYAESKSEKSFDFINKWGRKFNLMHEFEYHFDSKYNFQTINFGLPLVEQGLGLSNIMTLLLRLVIFDKPDTTIIFEEPETNLHPAFQSKLADLFLDAKKSYSSYPQFIIETHSEYMVRKFQYLVAKGEMKKEDVVIYYFHDPNNTPEGEKQVKKIEILEDGSLSDDFGTGFFDEADNLAINLFNFQNRKN
jgi:predicted ATP-dependent endonuclease of OLD family